MIIRLRSRDGLERIEIDPGSSIGNLKTSIANQFSVDPDQLYISKSQQLLLKEPEAIQNDLFLNDQQKLNDLKIQHGDMMFVWYPIERTVEKPKIQQNAFNSRPFGEKLTVEDLVRRMVQIERQEKPKCQSLSFDHQAANIFQSYVRNDLAFSVKRGGILYGKIDEEGQVQADVIYEPPQDATEDQLLFVRNTEEEQRADTIAQFLGLQRVGWVFSQTKTEDDYIMNNQEVLQMAQIQAEMGEYSSTAVIFLGSDEETDEPLVSFEAFQVSEQCIKLYSEGWFEHQNKSDELGNKLKLRHPKHQDDTTPLRVLGKHTDEVDSDMFLVPVPIKDHQGPYKVNFQVENRVINPTSQDLKELLSKSGSLESKVGDFHLLLWLSTQLDTSDIAMIAESIKDQKPLLDGHKFLIESIAGM